MAFFHIINYCILCFSQIHENISTLLAVWFCVTATINNMWTCLKRAVMVFYDPFPAPALSAQGPLLLCSVINFQNLPCLTITFYPLTSTISSLLTVTVTLSAFMTVFLDSVQVISSSNCPDISQSTMSPRFIRVFANDGILDFLRLKRIPQLFYFWDRVLPHSSGWPCTNYVAQSVPKLKVILLLQ